MSGGEIFIGSLFVCFLVVLALIMIDVLREGVELRKRGMGFHGMGRGGTAHLGGHGSPGPFAQRVIGGKPGFNASAPAPTFPGTGGLQTPPGSHAPTLPAIRKR